MKTASILSLLLAVFLFFGVGCDRPNRASPQTSKDSAQKSIFDYIKSGDTTGVLNWLNQSPDLNERNPQNITPLIAAIMYGRTAFVADLLEHGADVHLADGRGASPLHIAAQVGRADMIGLLLNAGADPTGTDADGLSAYDLAMMQGRADVAAAIAEARSIYLSIIKGEAPPEPEPAAIPPAVLLSTEFRVWTSASGEKMDAAFIQNVFDSVVLQNRQGDLFRISLNRLSGADQQLIRQLGGLDPHALARARGANFTSARPRDSIGMRIGKDRDWTVLENCRLLKRSGNDGDSFHVQHGGKEYIFRLYFVDAAETSMSYPQRVRDQADYFKLNTDATLKLGDAASKFSTSLLASGPFTVVTKWEDARGNSRLPRHYAVIVTPLGDLDELLTREGLARIYGMPIKTGEGQRKQSTLQKLEQEARQQKSGAWSKSGEQQARR